MATVPWDSSAETREGSFKTLMISPSRITGKRARRSTGHHDDQRRWSMDGLIVWCKSRLTPFQGDGATGIINVKILG
jgi:hypothetical protein